MTQALYAHMNNKIKKKKKRPSYKMRPTAGHRGSIKIIVESIIPLHEGSYPNKL
jgi:hypothetical protein